MTDSAPPVWPEPNLDFLTSTPTHPPFPVHSFGHAASYLQEIEQSSDLMVDYVASGLIAMVAALVGKTFSLKVTPERTEPLVIWSLMLGPPASGKTPSAKPVKTAIFNRECDLSGLFRAHVIASQTDKTDDEVAALQAKPPRYLAQNATIEALSEIESVSPYGLLLEFDELSGLFENLSRYNAGNDLHYYLEAWQAGKYRTDRIARGSTIIDNHLFGVWGGVQPDVLRIQLCDQTPDQGLLARFLIFNPQVRRPGALRPGIDHTALTEASQKLGVWNDGRIEEIDPIELKLSDSALSAFNQWRCTDFADRHGSEGKRGSALAKVEPQLLRLAGILHVLDWAFNDEEELPLEVSVDAMSDAVSLVEDYFVPQIELVYAMAGTDPVERMAIQMLKVICQDRLAEFRPRDAYRTWKLQGAFRKRGNDTIQSACRFMREQNLIRIDRSVRGVLYQVNPKLLDEALHYHRVIMLAQ